MLFTIKSAALGSFRQLIFDDLKANNNTNGRNLFDWPPKGQRTQWWLWNSQPGSVGQEPNQVWHWVPGRHHSSSPYNGREPTFQSENQMIDSDTRVTRRRRPTTECQWLSSNPDKAKQTQEMHCFAGRGLKCSDPILSEMSQSPWTWKKKSR